MRNVLPLTLALVCTHGAGAMEISTDVTVALAGTLAADEHVVEVSDDAATRIDLGALPAGADLIAYGVASDGDALFTLNTAVVLPGGLFATPRDVVRWDGMTYTVELRGSDRSVPVGARIDAVGVLEDDLLLSFDVTVTLGGVTANDEDLLRLESTQPDVWSLFFDGSAQGIPAGADLDGADAIEGTDRLALSFDISASVGGISFADEDVVALAPASGTWSMLYDGSASHLALTTADVDALFVPEPARGEVAILAALAALRRAGSTRAARGGSRRAGPPDRG